MSTWLSETEFRHSGATSVGVTINVAFLQEIKRDFGFRQLLNNVRQQFESNALDVSGQLPPRVAADLLSDLRDELETYFALEEFYGYFRSAATLNPCVSQKAEFLGSQHESLFLQLSAILETTQQIVYCEVGPDITIEHVVSEFRDFCQSFNEHEQSEMDLMMRLCNEELGVGD